MADRIPSPAGTTAIYGLVEARSPVIRYIGQSADPKRRFTKHARSHAKDFRTIVLHAAVAVGDVASFHLQEEIAHAIRSGHPLLNEGGLPGNLLSDERVRAARDLALTAVADGDGTGRALATALEEDRAMCAVQADIGSGGLRQPLARPTWRLDVRPTRTTPPPPGFVDVVDDPAPEAPLVDPSQQLAATQVLLTQYAVVRTATGLEAIADGDAMWASGQLARHNGDATRARFVRGHEAELRLPHRELGTVLDRHVPGATDRLRAMPGMEVGRRDSLILTTTDADQLTELARTLVELAVDVDTSPAKPVRQRTTSHDTQQVLLRASQALVLAGELRLAQESDDGRLRFPV